MIRSRGKYGACRSTGFRTGFRAIYLDIAWKLLAKLQTAAMNPFSQANKSFCLRKIFYRGGKLKQCVIICYRCINGTWFLMTFNYLCVGKLSCCKPSDSSTFTEGTRQPERDLHGRSIEGEKCVVSILRFPFLFIYLFIYKFRTFSVSLSLIPSFSILSFFLFFNSPLKDPAHICLTVGFNYCQFVTGMLLLRYARNTTAKQLL